MNEVQAQTSHVWERGFGFSQGMVYDASMCVGRAVRIRGPLCIIAVDGSTCATHDAERERLNPPAAGPRLVGPSKAST